MASGTDRVYPVITSIRVTPDVAERMIREAAKDTDRIIWGVHALERMDERGISDVQVLEILRTGMVFDAPEKTENGEWKCKIVKQLRGRRSAGVVTIFLHNGRLFLMTVEWEDIK